MAFTGNLNITLAFPCVSQGPLLKASKRHIKVLGPWCWFFLLLVLWPDWDPSSYCMSSSLTKSGSSSFFFFFSFFFFYFFLFPSFWDFEPSWSFLTSWIGPSFIKAHGLSLPFMEWAFLSNLGPQHMVISILIWIFQILRSYNIFDLTRICTKVESTWDPDLDIRI